MTFSKIHRVVVAGIRVAAVLYLVWSIYTFIADTVLLRNTKGAEEADKDDGTGMLHSIVTKLRGKA